MKNSSSFFRPAMLVVLIAVTSLAGCSSEPSLTAEQTKLRDQFLSSQPIEGKVQTPTDIKETADLPPDQIPPDEPVVIAGRIDAGDFEPFSKGEATFVMSQLPDEGHGEDDPDHADNCPFCKRTLQNAPKVLVRFQGSDGEIIPTGADELFGLAKDDVVVVKGDATFDSAVGTITVNATKIHRQ
ncbi:hypothetical protein [Rubripirellula obstinata]|nr:hypothetical protein [Rubripirellula obstinata]